MGVQPLIQGFFTTVHSQIATFVTGLARHAGLAQFAQTLQDSLMKWLNPRLLARFGAEGVLDKMGYISMDVQIGAQRKDDTVEFAHEQYIGVKLADIKPEVFVSPQAYLTFAMGVECKLS